MRTKLIPEEVSYAFWDPRSNRNFHYKRLNTLLLGGGLRTDTWVYLEEKEQTPPRSIDLIISPREAMLIVTPGIPKDPTAEMDVVMEDGIPKELEIVRPNMLAPYLRQVIDNHDISPGMKSSLQLMLGLTVPANQERMRVAIERGTKY